jgi:acyl-CoA reductase-like NAD-dependent aldehyde dehydrogenase
MTIISVNPATEEVVGTYEELSNAGIDQALAKAQKAQEKWRTVPISERASKLRAAGAYLRAHRDELARLTTVEVGKPIVQAEMEVEKCAFGCDYYADNAERFLAPESIPTNLAESFVSYAPLGLILAIMPWNFPYWQTFRPMAPGLMAGNGLILKHASNVSGCALAMKRVMLEAGFPDGLMQTLLVPSSRIDRLIEDPRIRLITLTGSVKAGSQVAAKAGGLLKKTILELGGSDPFIVLPDADLALAAKTGALARNQNSGQSCIAAKRFLVHEAVADEFERRLVDAITALKVGDPLDRTTNIGPLARADLLDVLERQVQATVAEGAKIALGGKRIAGRGYFFAPTVLTGVTPAMTAFREETFGPVAAVVRVKDVEEAIHFANDSEFGLGATILTRDLELARTLAGRIESGNVFVNTMVASDPRLPLGGVKSSGYGRELSSFGIRELCNIQTVGFGPLAPPAAAPAR